MASAEAPQQVRNRPREAGQVQEEIEVTQWHGGKGSGRRAGADDGAYARNYDAIFGSGEKAKEPEPETQPEPLGFRTDGRPIFPLRPGTVATCAFVTCCKCRAAIRSSGGPIMDARCLSCAAGSGTKASP